MQKMARWHNKEGGNHQEQESSRQKAMEDFDGELHPAVDGQSLGAGAVQSSCRAPLRCSPPLSKLSCKRSQYSLFWTRRTAVLWSCVWFTAVVAVTVSVDLMMAQLHTSYTRVEWGINVEVLEYGIASTALNCVLQRQIFGKPKQKQQNH